MSDFSPQNLTFDELEYMLREFADPTNECECGPTMPGTFAPVASGGDESHCWVESCGMCNRELGLDDTDIAHRIAIATGLNVRYRFDDPSMRYYRVFVARPYSPEDHDYIAVGANEFGVHAAGEVPIPPTDSLVLRQIFEIENELDRHRSDPDDVRRKASVEIYQKVKAAYEAFSKVSEVSPAARGVRARLIAATERTSIEMFGIDPSTVPPLTQQRPVRTSRDDFVTALHAHEEAVTKLIESIPPLVFDELAVIIPNIGQLEVHGEYGEEYEPRLRVQKIFDTDVRTVYWAGEFCLPGIDVDQLEKVIDDINIDLLDRYADLSGDTFLGTNNWER